MTEETKPKIDFSRLGTTSDDEKCKTAEIKRQVLIKNRDEELERIKKLQELQQDSKEETDEFYNLNREPLEIGTRIVKKILLSWGGGEDGFKLTFDKEGELLSGVYYMADWGEYEETDLTFDEAEEVFNFYMGGCLN